MNTFHVGSLPFMHTQQALDFTFKFEIPTLFTLPKLDKNQLIGADIINLLELGSINGYENIQLKENALKTQKDLDPFYSEEFFERLKSSGKSKFKYQSIGPISFYSLLKRSNKVEFSEVYNFLLQTYSHLFKKLSSHGEVVFVLDEPMLGNDFLSYHEALNNFVEDLKKVYPEVIVHCCAKLSLNEIECMKCDLNLDLNLYSNEELKELPAIHTPGLSYVDEKNYNVLVIKNLLKKATYFTPSCGLTYKNLEEIEKIYDFMGTLKNL